jgi:Calcineurin-like phosphoesterase
MRQLRATIAQISDLHINRRVNSHVKTMLKRLLKQNAPDIVIVSGDLANQPVPWQMKWAAQFLDEIRQSLDSYYVVIPGNHDFKLWGNVGIRRFTRIPFEIYFRRNGLHQARLWRIKEGFRLAWDALWWRGSAMREPVTWHPFPTMGIAVFAINSTTLYEMMAAGQVGSHDLQDLYDQIDELHKNPGGAFVYKIAVVHHHPAPIADAPVDAVARIQDSFMIFYNAGLFVRELSRRGVNLVLHGHKHVAGFLRVQCEFKDEGRTVLPIGAAGTATHPAPDDDRGHHLRLVRIFDDDTTSIEEIFFSASVEKKDDVSRTYDLETLEDVRHRRYGIFVKLRKYTVAELRKTVEITREGFSRIRIEYLGCRITATEGVSQIPLRLTTVRPRYIRGFEPTDSSPPLAKVPANDLYKIQGDFDLGRTFYRNDGAFDFGYSFRLMNGHVLTKEEFARHYSGTNSDSEWASKTANEACDLLTLIVKFPSKYDTSNLDFYALAEYVSAPLQGVDDERLDRGETMPHDVESNRITRNIRHDGDDWILTCTDPIPGMIYKLCWKFKDRHETDADLTVTARVDMVRERLLETAVELPIGHFAKRFAQVQAILSSLENDINTIVYGPQESFHVSLMVFDVKCQRLKFVGTNRDKLPNGDFYSGEGCAGFAFERVASILYHADRDKMGYFIREAERGDQSNSQEPIVLASIPWVHVSGDDRPMVVGVINISSALKNTKMLQLFDKPEAAVRILQDLQNLASLSTTKLFNHVAQWPLGV